jgi:PAS domain S-box-containing protein
MILDSSYDGLTYTNEDGIIVFSNEAYCRITGIGNEQIIGKSIYDLAQDGFPISQMVMGVFRTRETLSEVIRYNNSDKEVLVTIVPLYDNLGISRGIVGNVRDLTRLNELRNELLIINAKYSEEKQKHEEINKKLQMQLEKNKKLTERVNELINSFEHYELAINSKHSRYLAELAYRISHVDSTILITGDSGVGKDVFCRMVHKFYNKLKPYYKISCGAIPENLMESELFGYEPGAFTGASKTGKKGIFEVAQDGIVFLDEVGELSLPLQVKLLTVLQDRKFYRIGGTKEVKMEARIISATNRNLKDDVEKNKFRSDLYYRLNVIPVYISPLRERKDDIIPLAFNYLSKLNQKNNTNVKISFEVQKILLKYNWPGNIRELNNIIERMYVFNSDDIITVENLPYELSKLNEEADSDILKIDNKSNLKDAMETIEAKLILKHLNRDLTLQEIANNLGINISTLERKLVKYKLPRRYNRNDQ